MRGPMSQGFAIALGVLLCILGETPAAADHLAGLQGRTETLLPDGGHLIIGGTSSAGPSTQVAILDPTGAFTLRPPLLRARAWHTATLMPDGTVIVFGGRTNSGLATNMAERIDPSSGSVQSLSVPSLISRAQHTATLLTDGRVLLAGGWTGGGLPVDLAEVWDVEAGTVDRVPHATIAGRWGHHATLVADGSVWLTDGVNARGQVQSAERFDPVAIGLTSIAPGMGMPQPSGATQLAGSLPESEAVDVAPDIRIAMRFSKPLRVGTISTGTVNLSGLRGPEPRDVIPVEGGRLVFVTPHHPLAPGTVYTVIISGAEDEDHKPVASAMLRFTTASPHTHDTGTGPGDVRRPFEPRSGDPLRPTHAHSPAAMPQISALNEIDDPVWRGARRNGKPHAPAQDLPPLQAPSGVTALAGQVLRLDGQPLADVTLAIAEQSTRTDATGRFLLTSLPSGRQILLIDGSTANRPGQNFMTTDYGVILTGGTTMVLPFTIWMPVIDFRYPTPLSGPTRARTVVQHPDMPGLEVHVPANAELRLPHGRVDVLGLTQIPLDRPIFPVPPGTSFFFTPQAHGAEVRLPDGRVSPEGIRIVLPNPDHLPPGRRVELIAYDAEKDWHVYGHGTVSANGHQIEPDPGVDFKYLTCSFLLGLPSAFPGSVPAGQRAGDPVDLGSGFFTLEKADLVLPDVVPIVMTREHRAGDSIGRQLGVGFELSYNLYLAGDYTSFQWAELIRPDGSRLRYTRTSSGYDAASAIMEHTATPTVFQKSRLTWNATRAAWDLTLRDGTVYQFQGLSHWPGPLLIGIRDRAGNQLTITRSAPPNEKQITQITSPNGRLVQVTYNLSGYISQLRDNFGRTVSYGYDAQGRLATVTDAAGGVTTYTWASTPAQQITAIQDPRQITFLTNQYDGNGRVTQQTQADATTFQFAYTLDGNGKVTQTNVTDPRGIVGQLTFNGDGRSLTDTRAYGTAIAQTTTYERQATTNLITATTDALARRTEFTYDSKGNVLTVTRLAGTGQAVTTTFTYEPTFNQVATVTDALSHTTTLAYDGQGNLTTATDPLGHQTTIGYNAAGQPTTITTSAGTTQMGYTSGDLTSITDATGNTTARATDAAGRVVSVTSPLGQRTRFDYDLLNQLRRITDPLNGQTQFSYDGNGNMLSVTDARGNTTSYAYNAMDRATTRSDPLAHSETYTYDNNGNPIGFTDRKSQVRSTTYDALNRPTLVTYADGSTTSYTWDAGNRVTQIADSVGGTITRSYDGLDRMRAETTLQGTVSYTYDAAGRRASLTVPGQPAVTYAYDNADRLTSITQGASVVTFGYDTANRRTGLTLPSGVTTSYAYDAASRLTGLTYALGASAPSSTTTTPAGTARWLAEPGPARASPRWSPPRLTTPRTSKSSSEARP